MYKYTTCPRCGNYPVKATGTREDGYNYPGLEWSAQCDKCGYPEDEEEGDEE
jgi:ribosomal protein S27AE